MHQEQGQISIAPQDFAQLPVDELVMFCGNGKGIHRVSHDRLQIGLAAHLFQDCLNQLSIVTGGHFPRVHEADLSIGCGFDPLRSQSLSERK